MVSKAAIKRANETARANRAFGAKAITPRYVLATSNPRDKILDFGAGPIAMHTRMLRQAGLNVTAYEFGRNVVAGLHDPNALYRRYDTVFASNVMNVQSDLAMAAETLMCMARAVKRGGRLVFNYPLSPPILGLPLNELVEFVSELFGVAPVRVGGTRQAPILELQF